MSSNMERIPRSHFRLRTARSRPEVPTPSANEPTFQVVSVIPSICCPASPSNPTNEGKGDYDDDAEEAEEELEARLDTERPVESQGAIVADRAQRRLAEGAAMTSVRQQGNNIHLHTEAPNEYQSARSEQVRPANSTDKFPGLLRWPPASCLGNPGNRGYPKQLREPHAKRMRHAAPSPTPATPSGAMRLSLPCVANRTEDGALRGRMCELHDAPPVQQAASVPQRPCGGEGPAAFTFQLTDSMAKAGAGYPRRI